MTDLDFTKILYAPTTTLNFTTSETEVPIELFLDIGVVLNKIRENALAGHPPSILAVDATSG